LAFGEFYVISLYPYKPWLKFNVSLTRMTTVYFFRRMPAVSYFDELKKNLISLLVRFYLLHWLRYIGTLNILITKSKQILTRFIQALF